MKLFTNKRAETILEVTIALFIIGIGVSVSSMVMNRILNVTAQNKLWMQGVFLAKEGLEGVRNVRDSNWIKFSDPDCWKTIETGNVCDPMTSPMMADSNVKYYSLFFDHVDFTWSLGDKSDYSVSNFEFDNNAILARLPNMYSIHEKFLGPSNTKPIYIGETLGAANTNFYRRIKIQSMTADLDGDTTNLPDEVLIVTSEVKWAYKNKKFLNKVPHYSVSTMLTNYKE